MRISLAKVLERGVLPKFNMNFTKIQMNIDETMTADVILKAKKERSSWPDRRCSCSRSC